MFRYLGKHRKTRWTPLRLQLLILGCVTGVVTLMSGLGMEAIRILHGAPVPVLADRAAGPDGGALLPGAADALPGPGATAAVPSSEAPVPSSPGPTTAPEPRHTAGRQPDRPTTGPSPAPPRPVPTGALPGGSSVPTAAPTTVISSDPSTSQPATDPEPTFTIPWNP